MTATSAGPAPLRKGERTRRHIFASAIELFRERGYDGTTMRAIAERAGVSLGNSYHYFPNKEHLVREFYTRTCTEHTEQSRAAIADVTDLRERLLIISRLRIDILDPFHDVAGQLFSSVANPHSPLNPFSSESAPLREMSIAFMAEVVAGSSMRLPKDVAAELPRLLWLSHMGLVLLWTHDASRGQARTREVVVRSVDLIMSMLALSSLPLMRRPRRRLLDLIAAVAGTAVVET